VDLFGNDAPHAAMQTTIESFGLKHGLPIDVDLVLDCRFIPNPFWVDHLRSKSGLDEEVREFVLDKSVTQAFLDRAEHLLEMLLPAYVEEGKSYVTLALGCTGGRHRSVVIAEELAKRMRRFGFSPVVTHRDIDR
jgi:UPF0042 nucleotide-binding protein